MLYLIAHFPRKILTKTENRAINVYVVDDEKVIASTLAAILNMSGFRSKAFNSAETAILSAKSDCPALLITDVAMPEMNGIELAIHFKSFYPDCKVLLFSGQTASSDFLRTAAEQGHDFKLLTKPVHPTDLLAAVRALTLVSASAKSPYFNV